MNLDLSIYDYNFLVSQDYNQLIIYNFYFKYYDEDETYWTDTYTNLYVVLLSNDYQNFTQYLCYKVDDYYKFNFDSDLLVDNEHYETFVGDSYKDLIHNYYNDRCTDFMQSTIYYINKNNINDYITNNVVNAINNKDLSVDLSGQELAVSVDTDTVTTAINNSYSTDLSVVLVCFTAIICCIAILKRWFK